MDHIEILKRAFHITWRYRALWLIGLLLVLAGGSVIQAPGGAPGSPSSGPEVSGGGEEWQHLPEQWDELWETILPILIIVGVVVLTLVVVFVLIGIVTLAVRFVTRVSLIEMVDRYEETGEEVRFGQGLRLGWSNAAWQLFLVDLVLKLPLTFVIILGVMALVALAALSFIAGGPAIALGVVSLLLILPAVLVATVVGAVLGPIIQLAHRVAVIEKAGAWRAIVGAVGLIRRHFGAVALQWLLLVGLRMAWAVAMVPFNLVLVMLGLLIGGLPALLVGGLVSLVAGWPAGLVVGGLIMIPLTIALVGLPNLALNTAATIYHSVVWTLTYRAVQELEGETQLYRADPDDGGDLPDPEALPEA